MGVTRVSGGSRTKSFSEYKVQLDANANLNYAVVPSYTVGVTCNDSSGGADTKDLIVNIVDNASPVVTLSTTIKSISEIIALEDKLCDLTVVDTDPFTCNFSAVPDPAPFDIRYAVPSMFCS